MKIKHYAQPNDHLSGFRFDNFLMEIAAGLICSIFAVAGYKAGLLLLFVPTGLVTLICIVLVSHTIYSFVWKWIKIKMKSKADSKQTNKSLKQDKFSGALEHSQVMYIYPHKHEWKSEFENERDLIISTNEGSINVFHIGSTAIEGLYAKDCIDLLGVVENISAISDLKSHLLNLGYAHKGEYGISGREYFSKKQRKVHLHMFQIGDANVEKHLKFVNVMQGNSKLIAELNQIKQELHKKYPADKDSYQNEKAFFYDWVNKVL